MEADVRIRASWQACTTARWRLRWSLWVVGVVRQAGTGLVCESEGELQGGETPGPGLVAGSLAAGAQRVYRFQACSSQRRVYACDESGDRSEGGSGQRHPGI